ncbi:YkgJ family cysteine cluster protein [Methylobacterium terricola]|uniref:YkgJ family cysteine cluster protein n=1 Tax=Methylobacterium terricola TaxID=2583531 RepID=A0A5C4L771_9HYPH|nr:YkgJ family cysteine cluster protein [Methylobacterium terricola]TNC07250.1 YkgJ family cysteine cluster protein [Methylobacterium terricola]
MSQAPTSQAPADPATFSCQACGACCAYSAEWPRFSTEDDADIARIPVSYVDDPAGRMRCEGERCSALDGRIGERVACKVYAVRPEVCRTCEPGDPECLIARRHHGLPV